MRVAITSRALRSPAAGSPAAEIPAAGIPTAEVPAAACLSPASHHVSRAASRAPSRKKRVFEVFIGGCIGISRYGKYKRKNREMRQDGSNR